MKSLMGFDVYNMASTGDVYQNTKLDSERFRPYDYTAVVCYSQTSFAQYAEQKPLLRASGGDLGGGSEGLIVIKVETVGHDIRSTQFARGGAQTHYATQTTRNRR